MTQKPATPSRAKRARVLVVDDQRAMAELLAEELSDFGYDAVAVDSARAAMAMLESETIDAVVTDLRMQPVDGFTLLAHAQKLDPTRPVIIMTAYSAIDSAVEAIRRGAYHYLAKPFPLDELHIFLGRALEQRSVRQKAESFERVLGDGASLAGMVSKSAAMRELLGLVRRVAESDVSVLVLGETGSGKGRIVAALHAQSRRATEPFVAVNCAALPENLLESELFGHLKGAFTGATSARAGMFVEADRGTLFLDEIGDMSLGLQAKLLRAIEEHRVRPVGGDRERSVDVRILAATHRDLRAAVKAGLFREDLLYRIDVLTLELPPLRQRAADLPDLIADFFASARARYPDSPARRIGPEALAVLLAYSWPGNVRELAHTMERAVVLAASDTVDVAELAPALHRKLPSRERVLFRELMPLKELTGLYIDWAFQQLGENRTHTADKLGIDYKTLLRWLREPRPT